jgi:hypothetical protein
MMHYDSLQIHTHFLSANWRRVIYFFGNIMILYILWNFGKGTVVQCLNIQKMIICS